MLRVCRERHLSEYRFRLPAEDGTPRGRILFDVEEVTQLEDALFRMN